MVGIDLKVGTLKDQQVQLGQRQESVLGGGNSLNKGSEVALQKTPVQRAWGLKGEQDRVRAETGC